MSYEPPRPTLKIKLKIGGLASRPAPAPPPPEPSGSRQRQFRRPRSDSVPSPDAHFAIYHDVDTGGGNIYQPTVPSPAPSASSTDYQHPSAPSSASGSKKKKGKGPKGPTGPYVRKPPRISRAGQLLVGGKKQLPFREVLTNVLREVKKRDSYGFFLHPVTDVPGYSDVIKEPMDISTMESKRYRDFDSFEVGLQTEGE